MHAEDGNALAHAAPESVPGYDMAQPPVVDSGDAGIFRGRARRRADGLEVSITALALADRAAHGDEGAVDLAARLSRIKHSHLVRVHDVVPVTGADGEQNYVVLATSAVGGGSLTALLERRGVLPLGELITLLCPLAEALHHVHLSGAVHGRLTSDAVWLTDHGMPLLRDVGIDEIREVGSRARPGFDGCVAPEVLEGFAICAESDVYALASLAWQVLTGEPPGWLGVRGELAEMAPEVPTRVCDTLTRALSPEPGERPHLEEIIRELRGAGPAAPIDLSERDVGRDVPARIRALSTRQPSSHRAPIRRPGWALGAVLAACVVAGLVMVAWLASTLLAERAEPEATWRSAHGASAASQPSSTIATQGPTAAVAAPGPTERERPPRAKEGARLVQQVLQARSRAWESGNTAELSRAHAERSAALAADRSDLIAAKDLGLRYEHVAFVAEEVEILDVQRRESRPTREQAAQERFTEERQGSELRMKDASEFTARVTVHRQPLTVTSRDGDEQRVAATRDTVTMTLRRGPDGWRLWAWG